VAMTVTLALLTVQSWRKALQITRKENEQRKGNETKPVEEDPDVVEPAAELEASKDMTNVSLDIAPTAGENTNEIIICGEHKYSLDKKSEEEIADLYKLKALCESEKGHA